MLAIIITLIIVLVVAWKVSSYDRYRAALHSAHEALIKAVEAKDQAQILAWFERHLAEDVAITLYVEVKSIVTRGATPQTKLYTKPQFIALIERQITGLESYSYTGELNAFVMDKGSAVGTSMHTGSATGNRTRLINQKNIPLHYHAALPCKTAFFFVEKDTLYPQFTRLECEMPITMGVDRDNVDWQAMLKDAR